MPAEIRNNARTTFKVLALALLAALAAQAGAQETKTKKLYCWEENGKKVCDDHSSN